MIEKRPVVLFALLAVFACVPRVSPMSPAPKSNPTSCAGVVGADTTVYDTTEVTEQPITRAVPPLTYPQEAERRRIRGRVVVAAIANRDGVIDQASVSVIDSVHPALDAEAQRFVIGTVLWPACRNGEPVRVRIRVPVVFDPPRRIPGAREGFLLGLAVGLGAILGALLSGK